MFTRVERSTATYAHEFWVQSMFWLQSMSFTTRNRYSLTVDTTPETHGRLLRLTQGSCNAKTARLHGCNQRERGIIFANILSMPMNYTSRTFRAGRVVSDTFKAVKVLGHVRWPRLHSSLPTSGAKHSHLLGVLTKSWTCSTGSKPNMRWIVLPRDNLHGRQKKRCTANHTRCIRRDMREAI